MEIKPNPVLVGSSVFITLPAVLYFQQEQYIRGSIILACSAVSIAWHSTKPRYNWILIADMILANTMAVLAAESAMMSLPYSAIPFSLFMAKALILYYYGYQNACFCWNPDVAISTRWHAWLHIANSILAAWLIVTPKN